MSHHFSRDAPAETDSLFTLLEIHLVQVMLLHQLNQSTNLFQIEHVDR